MNLAVIGASGKVGTRLQAAAVRRGHQVLAVARRHGSSFAEGVLPRIVDAMNLDAHALQGMDAVIDAALPDDWPDTLPEQRVRHLAAVCQDVRARYLLLGHAGCLRLDEDAGPRWCASPHFPFHDRQRAQAQEVAVTWLESQAIAWTVCHPGGDFNPAGQATGLYRITPDIVPDGPDEISYADFAEGVLDAVEDAALVGRSVAIRR